MSTEFAAWSCESSLVSNGRRKPSSATPEPRLLGPKQDGYTTGERIQMRAKLRLVRCHCRAHPRQELPLVCEREASLQAGAGPWWRGEGEHKALTIVLSSPDNIPLYELRWPVQFESKGNRADKRRDRSR
jgi:hypothetical protein